MQEQLELYTAWAILGGVALFLIIRLIKFKSLRGAMFGAEVGRTIGKVQCSYPSFVDMSIRVCILDNSPDRAVGLEFVQKYLGSIQIRPTTLSIAESKNLISLLQAATNGR
jgi:hypothetical protein